MRTLFFLKKSKSSSCRLGKIEKSETSEVKEIGIRVILKKKAINYFFNQSRIKKFK